MDSFTEWNFLKASFSRNREVLGKYTLVTKRDILKLGLVRRKLGGEFTI